MGIVEDVRQERLRDEAPPKMVYTALAQAGSPPANVTMTVRTTGDPGALVTTVPGLVRSVAPLAMVS